MNKITCNVCLDLMPLVKDGVASEDSCMLVMEHTADCSRCADIYGKEADAGSDMDDSAVLVKIKKKIVIFIVCIMLAGMLFGMIISASMNMFYNAVIMPVIGGLGYVLLKKKAYFVPMGLFVFSFVWVSVREIIGGMLDYAGITDLVMMSVWWSVIFTAFSAVGILIAWLLHYSFRKEV